METVAQDGKFVTHTHTHTHTPLNKWILYIVDKAGFLRNKVSVKQGEWEGYNEPCFSGL